MLTSSSSYHSRPLLVFWCGVVNFPLIIGHQTSSLPTTMRTVSHSKRRKISPGLTKFYVQREEVNLNVALDAMRTMPCSQAAQQAEVYWMALLRDIPFSQFGTSNAVMQAVGNTQTRFSLLTLAFFSWFASCAPSQCSKDLRRPDLHRSVYRGRNPPPPFVPIQ